MLNVALGDRTGTTLAGLPRRVTLSHRAVAALAERCGVELPWRTDAAGLAAALGDRAPEANGPDVTAELAAAGLLDGTGVADEVVAAMTRLAASEVAVDLTLVLRRPSGAAAQLSAWHRIHGARVTTLTSTVERAELGWSAIGWWPATVSALVDVTVPPGGGRGPVPALCLPMELLLAAGTALRERRDDLLPLLVDRFPDGVTVDGVVLDRRRVLAELAVLAGPPHGRLQAVVTGGTDRIGIVSWLLFPDGWRELVPLRAGRSPLVRVDRVAPTALAARVAGLATRVRR